MTTALALCLLLLATACGDADDNSGASPDTGTPTASPTTAPDASPTTAPTQTELTGTSWVLTELNGQPLSEGILTTLVFNDGQAGGNSGCNDYGGAFSTTADGGFAMPDIERTEMGCTDPPGIMETETAYFVALAAATTYAVPEDTLTLSNANAAATLVFERDERSELAGTSWTLVRLDGAQPIGDTQITLAFVDDQVSGSSGCNQFSGSYETSDDNALTFGDLQSTLMFCAEPVGLAEQEQLFLAALAETAAYRIDHPNNNLELIAEAGQTRIVLASDGERMGTGLLDSTNWVLISLHGDAPTGACPTTLSLVSSQYDGEDGCDIYAGSINTTADGRIVELRTWGDEDNLSAYESTLLSAVQYRVEGSELVLVDADGQDALRYRPAEPTVEGLTDTVWQLVSLNGRQPIADSRVTLEISESGLGGISGCNSYGSSFIVSEPGVISIPGGAMTTMGCENPPGVMEQETEFTETLFREVVGYRLVGTTLEFLNAAGDSILIFE